jgi:hypothetical protein
MKVQVNSTGGNSTSTVTVDDVTSLRLEMPDGTVFSIVPGDNSLSLRESTYRSLLLRPVSANAVTVSGEDYS